MIALRYVYVRPIQAIETIGHLVMASPAASQRYSRSRSRSQGRPPRRGPGTGSDYT